MIVYMGGQIREEFRDREGNLAVLINHDRSKPKDFGVFLYKTSDDEFIHLTGPMSTNYAVDRVYLGLTSDAAREIAKKSDELRSGATTLTEIDHKLVYPILIRKETQTKPERIVLEATGNGYSATV